MNYVCTILDVHVINNNFKIYMKCSKIKVDRYYINVKKK